MILLGYVFDIIVRNRCKQHVWSSDISKLYNQLHLNISALPYSSLLFHDSLDSNIEPEVWVMTRVWYGISSTGGQGGAAIIKLIGMAEAEDLSAVETLEKDRFVDDLLGGNETRGGVKLQVDGITTILGRGGFSLKFIIHSRIKPCEKASSDGKSVKLLGYKWSTKEDTLSPGFSELNLNKKVRGAKKPNDSPVVTCEDAVKLLSSVTITKRLVVSKVSEFFDPIGLFEPIKLQLKLEMRKLTGLAWDEEIPLEQQMKWRMLLANFVKLHELSAPRCVIPSDKDSVSKIRLLCISDAAEHAGGGAQQSMQEENSKMAHGAVL